jgi:hypothetical protein
MRKTIGTFAMAGMLLAATAGPALAHKPDNAGGPPSRVVVGQAERQCERQQGGTFIDLGGLAYVCLLPTGASERDIRQAERTCERAGGELFVAVGNVAYACVLPGGGDLLNDFVDTGGVDGGTLLGPDGLRLFPIIVS